MKKSVKILVIVLVLIIVGLISYIVVDKIDNGKKGEESKSSNATSSTANSEKIADALRNERSKVVKKYAGEGEATMKFMKVATDVYLVEVVTEPTGVEYYNEFLVSYKNNEVTFEQLFDEPYKGGTDIFVDTENHVIKSEITKKSVTRREFYDISNAKFDLKDSFVEPYEPDDSTEGGYYKNDDELSKEQYDKELAKYNKYSFKKFAESAVELNDENIDKIVK